MAFVTNQELRLAERGALSDSVEGPVEVFHLERLTGILDRPDMRAVRAQYLHIDPPAAAPAPEPRTFRQVLDAAPTPPGAPDHRMLHDGLLLLQVAALPVCAGWVPQDHGFVVGSRCLRLALPVAGPGCSYNPTNLPWDDWFIDIVERVTAALRFTGEVFRSQQP